MITNSVPFVFGPGATFRRRDGEVVVWSHRCCNDPICTIEGVGNWLYNPSGIVPGRIPGNETDLVEQLTLPYDAKPIELAVGQVWLGKILKREFGILQVKHGYVAYECESHYQKYYMNTCTEFEFKELVQIPQPAVRPKRKVTTKLWVYESMHKSIIGKEDFVQHTVKRSAQPYSVLKCLGAIEGSEREEEEVEG